MKKIGVMLIDQSLLSEIVNAVASQRLTHKKRGKSVSTFPLHDLIRINKNDLL